VIMRCVVVRCIVMRCVVMRCVVMVRCVFKVGEDELCMCM
jgi:hypothetical protein